ncbi:MAG: class I SAM-dependent methyltransferase, partial [bacterium]|nr:class I SAM-dependent methyltransferase [bacterium]
KHSALYHNARPTYPPQLFEYLASLTKKHELVWDCATGNGQAALMLSGYYQKVIATDASAEQIKESTPKENIEYRVSPAENSFLPNHSADLVTVAQALHWFNFDAFFAESKRVLKPDGILAVWFYELLKTESPELNKLINTFYVDIIGSYWPKERKHIDDKYQNIDFPFTRLKTPSFDIKPNWDVADLFNYLSSWSAVQYFQQKNQLNPIEDWLKPRVLKHLKLESKLSITIPLYLIAGFINGQKEI